MDNNELIKQFNSSTRVYLNKKSDEHLSNIQRSLQMLFASSDSAVFDLTNKYINDFFVNLHELMFIIDSNSSVMWSSINVLLEACRNSSTRERLIKTFKFTAILSKLLRLDLGSNEKNIKILQLLQELTYEIKISWQEAHLGSLISILTKWIVGSDQQLVLLSLGVLVNLCYKNIPAVYILLRCVDIKKFIKAILMLQRNNDPLRVQVCKLLIILQDVSGGVPDPEIGVYIKSTCPTLLEALHSGNSCLMRQVVNFFKEIVCNSKSSNKIMNYKNFSNDTEKLLNSIKEEGVSLECVRVLFEYLSCLVNLDGLNLEVYFPRLLQLALRWVTIDDVSTDSIKLISCIVSKKCLMPKENPVSKAIDDLLEEHISVILSNLVFNDCGPLTNDNYCKLIALLGLLSILLKEPKLAEKISSSVNQSELEKLFIPLRNPVFGDSNFFQEPFYTFYVEVVLFLTELAEKETNWFLMYRELLREKQILMLLSIALYTGPEHIKKKVLYLTGTSGFSAESVGTLAGCMYELNKLIIFSPSEKIYEDYSSATSVCNMTPMDITPLLTATQEGYLNNLLDKYEHAASSSDNLTASSLMELYQFKIAALNQNLRSMQTSQEAADLRATRLQHSLALTSSEVSRLHQMLHSCQQNVEVSEREVAKINTRKAELETQVQEIHNKYDQSIQTLKSKTRIISEQNEYIDQLKVKIKDNEKDVYQLKEEVQKLIEINEGLKKENSLLEDNIESLQKAISEHKKENDSNHKKIGTLKKEIMAQSDMISELQLQNSEKEKELGNLFKELQEQKRTRDRIVEVALGKL